jgi:hypothetical protein
VHIGGNPGGVPVVLDVLYVRPAGSPLSEDAADPGGDGRQARVISGWSTMRGGPDQGTVEA